jgi:hypothetical protein
MRSVHRQKHSEIFMYKVLWPNGIWTLPEPNGPRLSTKKEAIEFARRTARIHDDNGEFLIFKNDDLNPCASTRMILHVS